MWATYGSWAEAIFMVPLVLGSEMTSRDGLLLVVRGLTFDGLDSTSTLAPAFKDTLTVEREELPRSQLSPHVTKSSDFSGALATADEVHQYLHPSAKPENVKHDDSSTLVDSSRRKIYHAITSYFNIAHTATKTLS